jgi:pimeloyl-ACP methyl ester carboxylesterase
VFYHLYIEQLGYLESPRPSFGLRSAYPADTVIFFVHGFGGSALETWRQFDSLVETQEAFKTCDLVFLGYDSVRRQTHSSSDSLYKCCNTIIEDAPHFARNDFAYDTLRRAEDHRYKHVVFVAHSLGAIVTRQILLMAERRTATWLSLVELTLFAPAHMGATDITKLATAVPNLFGRVGAVMSSIVRWKVQTLREVEEGSTTLSALMIERTESLAACDERDSSTGHLIAKQVYFGDDENVVAMNRFCRDPDHIQISNQNHTSVCKPTSKYDIPFRFLMKE